MIKYLKSLFNKIDKRILNQYYLKDVKNKSNMKGTIARRGWAARPFKEIIMKSLAMKLMTIIVVLCLLPIFMAQDGCEEYKNIGDYKQVILSLKSRLYDTKQHELEKIYVSFLSFQEVINHQVYFNTEHAEFINISSLRWLKELQKYIPDLVVNEPGHSIKNTDENGKKLMNIIYGTDLSITEKINKVIDEMMIPNHVDIIVTGQFINQAKDPWINYRPLVIVKYYKKVISKNFKFRKEELFCKDPTNKKIIICSGGRDQLLQAFQDLTNML